eukprot:Protomagalhaensia_sp_Gyna_25__763@NODE_1365_length_1906_cov_4_294055_g1097_i0_p2_GENE_NODE_1365_length_1906_cov_4_294055_g1097_i0NODE_1365_length_1906_cov_4_294055_g1097_i0_p2_ORF_typecomplete_len149_score20_18DUF1980/PF09323_10/4_7e02DUF1980/PF09323_10/1_8_NODE_1365_length_1906_cov_4_294055_g1097_i09761422
MERHHLNHRSTQNRLRVFYVGWCIHASVLHWPDLVGEIPPPSAVFSSVFLKKNFGDAVVEAQSSGGHRHSHQLRAHLSWDAWICHWLVLPVLALTLCLVAADEAAVDEESLLALLGTDCLAEKNPRVVLLKWRDPLLLDQRQYRVRQD